jgi:hypothetical protein
LVTFKIKSSRLYDKPKPYFKLAREKRVIFKNKVIRSSSSFREKDLMILELDSSLVRNRPITFSQRKLSSSKVLIFALPLNICFVFLFVSSVLWPFFSQRLLLELHIKIVTKCNGKIFTFSSLNICKYFTTAQFAF